MSGGGGGREGGGERGEGRGGGGRGRDTTMSLCSGHVWGDWGMGMCQVSGHAMCVCEGVAGAYTAKPPWLF